MKSIVKLSKTICLVGCTMLLMEKPILAHSQRKEDPRTQAGSTTSIEKQLQRIEKATGYTFLYKKEDLKNLSNVKDLPIKTNNIRQVLTELLTPLGVQFEIDDKVIILKKRTPQANNSTVSALQDIRVKGYVTSAEGERLAAVTIYVKEARQKVFVTQDDGTYQVSVPASVTNPTLVFKHIGMVTKEVVVGNRSELNVQLTPTVNAIEETVIKGGYGLAQKRSDMVGSAFQVTSEQIKNLPGQRVDNLLEGLVPGLQINVNTDQASSTRPRMNLRVRGEASLSASNEPIWIVDGIRVYTGDRTNMIPGTNTSVTPLSYLNPDDIESLTVLKDATMASIYGADGANGVILITTKKGLKSKPMLSVTSRYGQSTINQSTKFKVLNSAQYMELAKESFLNVPTNDWVNFPYHDTQNDQYSTTNTDWTDVYYGTGTYLQNNLGIRGGNDVTNYYISGEYFKNKSSIKGNEQDRFALNSNIDFNISDKLNLSLSMSASYNVHDIFNPSNDYFQTLPILSPYNLDGSYKFWYDQTLLVTDPITGVQSAIINPRKFFNSVAEREENDDIQRSFYTVNNLVLNYSITPSLKLTSQFGANYQNNHEEIYAARSNWSGISSQGVPTGYATRANANFLLWTVIERLNYNKKIGKHTIGGLLGFEASSQDNRSLSARGSGFANDHIKEVSYAAIRENGASSSGRVRRSSFFGQGSYNYDNRYYATFNVRSDGNSDFGEDTQWGTFYSAGASWNIHNEAFYHSDIFNRLKIKGSFGTNGNSRLGSIRAKGLYNYQSSSNYMGLSGTTMASVWNRNLSWEHSYMTNIGINTLIKGFLDIELEVYNKKTVDLLQDQDVSRTTGDTRVANNIGSTQNRGIELNIESANINRDHFTWTTKLNASRNENKLLELYEGISQTRDRTIWMEGHDLGTYYLVRWAGVDPRDGAPLWYDAQGNITRIFNNQDRVPYKNSTPEFYGGVTNTIRYKDWTMSFLATYSVGGYRFTSFGRNVSSDGLHLMEDNQSINQLDRWQQPGDLALSPKPLWQVSNASSTLNSSRYLYNATFLRLKNIYLAHQLNGNWIKKTGLKSANVTFTADNLGVWTPYDQKDRNSYKQAMSGYPMERTFSIGLNVQL